MEARPARQLQGPPLHPGSPEPTWVIHVEVHCARGRRDKPRPCEMERRGAAVWEKIGAKWGGAFTLGRSCKTG